MSATRGEVREAVAAAIYETFPRIQAPESPAPKWDDCKTRYRREWYRCADAAIAAAEQAGWVLRPVEPTEEMIEDLAIKLYEERARNRGLPMAKWENAPELVHSLERRDAATAYRLVLAAAPKVTP